jgi:hypothetical protein
MPRPSHFGPFGAPFGAKEKKKIDAIRPMDYNSRSISIIEAR